MRLYAEGVQEPGYYEATAEASQYCLQAAQQTRVQSKHGKFISLHYLVNLY